MRVRSSLRREEHVGVVLDAQLLDRRGDPDHHVVDGEEGAPAVSHEHILARDGLR